MSAKCVFVGVTVDSKVQFGRPCMAGTGIPTKVVAGRFVTGESVHVIAEDYDIKSEQIDDALRWELLDRDARRRRIAKAERRG